MAEITCIGCPMGCRISVQQDSTGWVIHGQACQRGEIYARNELTVPRRVVTGVVTIAGSRKLLPVKTATPIPKDKMAAAMTEIQRTQSIPPIKIGQIVKENIAGTGISLVATKNIPL